MAFLIKILSKNGYNYFFSLINYHSIFSQSKTKNNHLEVAHDTNIVHTKIKKTIVILSMVSIAMVPVIGLSSFCSSKVVPMTSEVHANGYGDGHCTKCGLSNGIYNCKRFVPTNNYSSICTCGHSKAAHAYR